MSRERTSRATGLAAWFLIAACAPGFAQHTGQPESPPRVRNNDLTLSEASQIVNDPDWVIVDTRPTDAFNGWKLEGVKRGGHLPNAVDFPAGWLRVEHANKAELLSVALRVKGITPDRKILLYSVDAQDRDRVAAYLRQAGYRHVRGFDFRSWAEDDTKPLTRYPNFHLIVPPSVVKQLIDGDLPETFKESRRVKLVEVSWGKEAASYLKGHVPGSFHVNTDDFEPPPTWALGSPELLAGFAKKYGFQAGDTVIISGEDPTASYRLAVVLRYMGVDDVRVLNGGFAAWKAARYPIETKSNPPPSAPTFGKRIPQRPGLVDSIARVRKQLAASAEFTLVDTRTWAEYTGETSGYKYHFRKGRIPGSVYGQADFKGPNSLTPYRNIDNTMRNADEIRSLWAKSGIDTRNHLSFMCGGGWRAAEVQTFAHVMGLSKASLYSDGWIGWSNEPQNPTDTGPPAGSTSNPPR